MSHVNYKKWKCRPVEFKKTYCRLSQKPKLGRVALSILGVYTPCMGPPKCLDLRGGQPKYKLRIPVNWYCTTGTQTQSQFPTLCGATGMKPKLPELMLGPWTLEFERAAWHFLFKWKCNIMII